MNFIVLSSIMLSFITLTKVKKFYEIMANSHSGCLSGCLFFSEVVFSFLFLFFFSDVFHGIRGC